MEIVLDDDNSVLARAAEVFAGGGVVLHPTETCYGLAVDIFNQNALAKLYRVKGMDLSKPLSVLVDSLEMAYEFGVFSALAKKLATKHWPGPLSIMVPRSEKLPEFFNEGHDFVSLRFSSHPLAQKLVSCFGSPLTTTSANRAGEEQFYELDPDVVLAKLPGVDLLVDAGPLAMEKPSTIVRVDGDNLEIVRRGGFFLDENIKDGVD